MNRLFEEFPPVSTAEWEAQLAKDLKGRDGKSLVWHTEDGIAVKPYYRMEDVASLPLPEPSPAGRSWHIGCEVNDAASVQQALAQGAQALILPIALVEQVPLDTTSIHVKAAPSRMFAHATGSFAKDPMDMSPDSAKDYLARARAAAPTMAPFVIDILRFHNAGATATQELAFAMAAGAQAMDDVGVMDDLIFSFGIGSNYFFEIAKLRAARLLWRQVVSAFGGGGRAEIHIHAHTSSWNKSVYDSHNNLLRGTTEAMAAVLGGCEMLNVGRFDQTYAAPNELSRRLALNTQLILRDEAYFGKAVDPAAGCWYVEALTDELARAAWKLFQEIEAAGGFRRADLDALAGQSKAKRAAEIARRKRVMVGVNQYVSLNEQAPGEFDNGRAAYPFEALRRNTERSGKTPVVLLVKLGDAKMRRARAEFCAGYFACAGFTVADPPPFENADAALDAVAESRPDLVVLCSSDREYVSLAESLCPRVRQPVMVAGHPKEAVERLRSLGVADFVYQGSDAVEFLSRWQGKLGAN